jgi:sulfopyruvate decarboxylase subunit beta
MLGTMGLSSSIGLGVALAQDKTVISILASITKL